MPDADATYDFLADRGNKVQVQTGAFLADFPLPSNLYDALVACGARDNWGGYCNRELGKPAAEATALRATDPGAALREWTQIDRALTDHAAIMPMVNIIYSWFVSERVRNFQSSQYFGPVLSQIWVK